MPYPSNETSKVGLFLLALLAGVLYSAVHIFNGWVFQSIEFTEHISLLYLPSFLRLFNVLVLGLLWGSLGTWFGCMLLYFWLNDNLLLSMCNAAVSASSGAVAVWVLGILQHRKLSITRLSDLFQLALLCSLLNALLHHLMWSLLDPSQLISSNQLALMAIGDINGAIAGALMLRWLASRTQLVAYVRQKAVTQSTRD
jgi:hypothetical protein